MANYKRLVGQSENIQKIELTAASNNLYTYWWLELIPSVELNN